MKVITIVVIWFERANLRETTSRDWEIIFAFDNPILYEGYEVLNVTLKQ